MSRDSLTNIDVEEKCNISPVHKLITFYLRLPKARVIKRIFFRNKSEFSSVTFIEAVTQKIDAELNVLCIHNDLLQRFECVDCVMSVYNIVIKNEYEDQCPQLENVITVKDKPPWFNGEILQLKREKRRKECKLRRLKTTSAWEEFKSVKNQYNYLIRRRNSEYYNLKIHEAGSDVAKLYRFLNGLTGSVKKKELPDGFSDCNLAEAFFSVF